MRELGDHHRRDEEMGGVDAFAKTPANYQPLSPLSFLARSAAVFPDKIAIINGAKTITYRTFRDRVEHLAGALNSAGVARGDVVAVMLPNSPEMLEAHFAVPLSGAILCSINTRLDAETVGFILDHSGARILIVDREYAAIIHQALALHVSPPVVISVCERDLIHDLGDVVYEDFLASGHPRSISESLPDDEWDAIALNYTSGTTGDPKGVVLHHRGAYLNAIGNVLSMGFSADSVYLWTLPMFHCNGWTHTWAVTLAGGVHVCQRRVEPDEIYAAIARHGVTHLSGAPVVLGMLANAPQASRHTFDHRVRVATGGAAPTTAILEKMEAAGFDITHLYGMTESYGPSAVCTPQPGLEDRSLTERAAFVARQGVAHPTAGGVDVRDPETGQPVPRDGSAMGELVVRGNTVMKGYFRNPAATRKALSDGWLWTGDLAVIHPDGYVEIKDRSKDIIISGGENISSLEVEEVIYRHPAVLEAAVVARPDDKWGETPHAFVTPRDGAVVDASELAGWCREKLAGFKAPRHFTFGPLPKTATGKIQKNLLRDQANALSKEAPA